MKILLSILLCSLLSCNCVTLGDGNGKSVKDIIRENNDSVVLISNRTGSCTGFAISEQYVVTAGHCVNTEDVLLYVIDNNDKTHIAIPVLDNDDKDLAVLYVLDIKFKPLIMGSEPSLGERLIVVGNPGYSKATRMFEVGYLKKTMITEDGRHILVSDNIINAGESGAPVFDEKGDVVGVAVGVQPVSETYAGFDGNIYKDISLIVSIKDLEELYYNL